MNKEINYSEGFLSEKVPFVFDKHLPWSKELEVSVDKFPVIAVDYPPYLRSFLFLVISLFLILSGIMIAYGSEESAFFMFNTDILLQSSVSKPLQASFIGWILFVLGLTSFFYNFFFLFLRKSYVISFRYITLNIRNLFRNKTFMEAISNYKAIRYRVFISNDNQPLYVIDVWHEDPIKNIPLYISKNGFGIYNKLKKYSQKLNLPIYFALDNKDIYSTEKVSNTEESLFSFSTPKKISSHLVHFPWKVFFSSLAFFVLLDLIIFTSDWSEIISVPFLFIWLFVSSFLVFFLPLLWNYRRQEITLRESDIIIEDLVFNSVSINKHEINKKDIFSIDLVSFKKDSYGLTINTSNGVLLVGYGSSVSDLEALKRTLEKDLNIKD